MIDYDPWALGAGEKHRSENFQDLVTKFFEHVKNVTSISIVQKSSKTKSITGDNL